MEDVRAALGGVNTAKRSGEEGEVVVRSGGATFYPPLIPKDLREGIGSRSKTGSRKRKIKILQSLCF